MPHNGDREKMAAFLPTEWHSQTPPPEPTANTSAGETRAEETACQTALSNGLQIGTGKVTSHLICVTAGGRSVLGVNYQMCSKDNILKQADNQERD